MHSPHAATRFNACRHLAMEQNEKLFEEANVLNRSALDLLDRPDLDDEMFLDYLRLRDKAHALFQEALDHLSLINEQLPPLREPRLSRVGTNPVDFIRPRPERVVSTATRV
ncbi:hypothetical protein [Pseudomonas vancouverensis]|uniref:hypothetical protein n=1 Tax=Pseudomonas vancouverensis TaxID=95300 RepID=UPI00087A0035|nr:hypothetical protein [Pseudomonas vancouverensis]SDV04187.1 hypothetical protein SAMN05216558_2179 [Pseudomonas vancouverensis]